MEMAKQPSLQRHANVSVGGSGADLVNTLEGEVKGHISCEVKI